MFDLSRIFVFQGAKSRKTATNWKRYAHLHHRLIPFRISLMGRGKMPEPRVVVEGREIWKWPVKVRSRVQRTWLTGVEHADLERTSSSNLLSLSLSLLPSSLFFIDFLLSTAISSLPSSASSLLPPLRIAFDRRLRVTFERSSVLSLAFKPSHTKVREFKRKKGRPSAILYRLSINEKSNRFQHGSFCSTCFVKYLRGPIAFNYYYTGTFL